MGVIEFFQSADVTLSQKLLEVVSPLLDRFSSKKRTSTMLETWYGLCSVLLGYPDVALAWAEKASRRGPSDAYWISILGVRTSAFVMLDDEAALLAAFDRGRPPRRGPSRREMAGGVRPRR